MKKYFIKALLLALALCATLAFSSCDPESQESSLNGDVLGFENSVNASQQQGSLGQWADGQ